MSGWLWVSLACNLLLAIGCVMALGWGSDYHEANKMLRNRLAMLTDPEPVCGCLHHFSFHDEGGCHNTVIHQRPGWNGPRAVLTTCPCVQYIGPEPLPRIIDLPKRREEET